MVKDKFNLFWTTPNGVAPWALDEDVLKKMKESGCYRISLKPDNLGIFTAAPHTYRN